MTIKYKIDFLDYWHLSSGLSAGTKYDSMVIKDKYGLPYASGKTLKGLIREMALEFECDFIDTCFGTTTDEKDACYKKDNKHSEGECHFSNATLLKPIKEQIVSNKLQDNLYDEITSTKIDTQGIALSGSLRQIEVVIPLTLHGEITDVPAEYEEEMKKSLEMIKRMGLNRNRGLGRCTVTTEGVEA